METNTLFENAVEYPDPDYQVRLDALIGLDAEKDRLTKILSILVNPEGLKSWAKTHHSSARSILDYVLRRPPLVVLEGDVGSGKSELASCIGHSVARQEKINVTLFPLSLSSRGEGRVGQMTQLISAAFEETIKHAKKLKTENGKCRGAVILLVDEADALAQSRESSQMHHEDKAGVNAFIRGIDNLGNGKYPAAVIMCTNRLKSLDPAVQRRAADILSFRRPDLNQRKAILKTALSEIGFTSSDIEQLAELTGKNNGHEYGFTASDLVQRLIPIIVLDAYPKNPATPERAIEVAKNLKPTPPFNEV